MPGRSIAAVRPPRARPSPRFTPAAVPMADWQTPAVEPAFPLWLPELVAAHARRVYGDALTAGNKDEAAAIMRITIDPRMEGVWSYLRRRRRDEEYVRTHEYEHAARDDA